MFAAAEALTPKSMRRIAVEGFAEMRAAGYGVVGEFHYVHRQPGGTRTRIPMRSLAVAQGAEAAGLAAVMLPAAYPQRLGRR